MLETESKGKGFLFLSQCVLTFLLTMGKFVTQRGVGVGVSEIACPNSYLSCGSD